MGVGVARIVISVLTIAAFGWFLQDGVLWHRRSGLDFVGVIMGGQLSILVIPLAAVLAGWWTSARSVGRAGLALGSILVGAWTVHALAVWTDPWPWPFWLLLAAGAAAVLPLVLSIRAAGLEAWRATWSSVALGVVAPPLVAGVLYFPRDWGENAGDGRAWVSGWLVVGAIMVLLATRDLLANRTRAILWTAGATVALALARPVLVASGCIVRPGIVEAVLAKPAVLTAFALLPWIGPVISFMCRSDRTVRSQGAPQGRAADRPQT